MKEKNRVLAFSVFDGNFFGHGGEKRTRQIEEIVSFNNEYRHVKCPFKYNHVEIAKFRTKFRRSYHIPKVISALKSNRRKLSLNNLLNESVKYYRQEKFVLSQSELISNSDTIIWENNFPDFFYLPYILKSQYRKRVIACPHNLESLISYQKLNWKGKSKLHFLEQELEILGLCDEVFTISEEEQWLLNLFGIPARHLPYFPLGGLYDSLTSIRNYRTENERGEFFLIVGSASNPPTRIGMSTLLSDIKKFSTSKSRSHKFKVTGYGTQALAKEFNSPNIEILGFSEDGILIDLMKNCKAMVVNQAYSTGALTRIPETLVAGIPIISNEGGARSYRRLAGISVFNSLEDFEELLLTELPMPQIPEIPQNFFNAFMDMCKP